MWKQKQVGRKATQWLSLIFLVALTSPFNVSAADEYTPSGSNSFMYPGEPVPEDEMRVTIFGSGYGYVRGGQADQSIYCQRRREMGPVRRRKKGPGWVLVLSPESTGGTRARSSVPLTRLTRRRAWEGPVGPRGQAVSMVVSGVALLRAALVEPVAVAVHFEDVDVVGEPVEQRAGQSL